jgi:hypothetical protein
VCATPKKHAPHRLTARRLLDDDCKFWRSALIGRHAAGSIVERQNLSLRMGVRRFTRLTNAFSKKWENHWAMIALWFAFYNFCRVHKSIRMTPAMAAGISDHIWTVRELLEAA